jgi:hypothetical protein
MVLTMTNCSEEETVDIKDNLINKFWTWDKIKLPDSNSFESPIFKSIYFFNENGDCLIKRPYQNIDMDKVDTIRKYVSWRLEQNVIQLIGKDTITFGTDTLIFDMADWKVLEINNNTLKVDNLKADGLSNNTISILTTK